MKRIATICFALLLIGAGAACLAHSQNTAGKRFGDVWSSISLDKKAISEPLAGYAMHFTVDAAGKTYSVSLTEKSDYSSFFTDERGLIYEAKPIQ